DNDLDHYMGRDFVVDYMADFYTYAMACFDEMPSDRGRVILYEDLTQRLYETIHGIYDAFGFAMSSEFDAYLRDEDTRAKQYKSEHRYDLGKYGLDDDTVRHRFSEVFERYPLFEETPHAHAAAEA